jgi:3-phosphoshikimate 1-carboxyvinyltransferase
MPLPELIEIVPLRQPVRAEITVPGSKSITNRALVLAALANGTTTLRGALWSEDTQVMVEALKTLGFTLDVQPDAEEASNRTITIEGLGGAIPNTGSVGRPLDLFVGNAGTAARFLAALVCLGRGAYRLSGIPRMHQRPQAALFAALRELGYQVEATNDNLPAIIQGTGPRAHAACTVSIEASSQFASALLLCAPTGGWKVTVTGENAEESPYVAMTAKLIEAFPKAGGDFLIEPDASSGSYFLAAQRLVPSGPERLEFSERFGVDVTTAELNLIAVADWPASGWQIDGRFRDFVFAGAGFGLDPTDLRELLATHRNDPQELAARWTELQSKVEVSRKLDLGDSIMTAVVMAPLEFARMKFTDLGRLRLQECERVVALRTELTKCGARVVEEGDTLIVYPSELHGAEIETYDDHRMAMCFATLGLKVPGMRIKNPACVKKTFPNFFQKLAAAPPRGLGATMLDVATGRALAGEDLLPA